MPDILEDTVTHPKHYEIYPVQPIEITRHLGFCLGNVVKYVLRAPYKGGVEDCDKALEYLRLEAGTPQAPLSHFAFLELRLGREKLIGFLCSASGDMLWEDIAKYQKKFLVELGYYLCSLECGSLEDGHGGNPVRRMFMAKEIKELRRVLTLRDTTGQIYEGLRGLPRMEAEHGQDWCHLYLPRLRRGLCNL